MEQSPRLEQTSVTNWHTAMQTLGPGKLLRSGRYSIIASVALPQQNQGTAWSARDLHMSNRLVLLREIRISAELASTALKGEQMVTMLAQRLNRLGEHPGLPNIVDLFKEKDAYFLVFLLPQGRSLAQILKLSGLPEHTVAEYGWQMCDILSLLAEQQPPLVHGAISPETILISENGKQAALLHLPVLPPREITSGMLTPSSYRAPEQVHGTLTPSSDLYALAATLYHAATGSDPQQRPPAFYPPARRINPEVSVAMERILARQLRLSATQRYSSAYEMQQDLAALIESYPTQASKSIVPIQTLPAPVQGIKSGERWELPGRAWRRLISLFMGVLVL
jgi:serine/threonine protein kinase